jgi:hypothetical protein
MERELLSEAGLRPLKLGVGVADDRTLPARSERGFEVERRCVSPAIGDILVQMSLGSRSSGLAKRAGSSQDRAKS